MRCRKPARVDLGPASSVTVAGPPGGRLGVWAHGRAVEIEVPEGETSAQVARRLADALRGDGVPAEASGGTLDVDLSGRRRWESEPA